MYQVFDNCNKFVGTFRKYNDADNYRHLMGRPDWSIKPVPKKFFTSSSTEKQRRAVRYCEDWLHITFAGDINHFQACSDFLSHYLDLAKATEAQHKAEIAKQKEIQQEAINQFYLKTDAIGDYDSTMG